MRSWVIVGFLLALLGSAVNASTILVSQNPVALAIEAGNQYAKKGEHITALTWFDKALYLDQSSAPAYHNKGVAYHTLGQSENAIASFQKAVEADPSYAKAHYSLSLEYYYQKHYENSIEELKKVIELEPNNANAHFDLGVMHIERFRIKENLGVITEDDVGDLEQGLHHYRTVLSINPELPHASQNAIIVKNVLEEYST